jgi:hypothetical protein
LLISSITNRSHHAHPLPTRIQPTPTTSPFNIPWLLTSLSHLLSPCSLYTTLLVSSLQSARVTQQHSNVTEYVAQHNNNSTRTLITLLFSQAETANWKTMEQDNRVITLSLVQLESTTSIQAHESTRQDAANT